MNNYLDRYRKRNLGDAKSILEKERLEIIGDFNEYLESHALSSHEVFYTKPDELPNLETNETERMAIIDVANNDKTNLDEKYLLCRNSCDIDVGCYIYWNDSFYLLIFEEVKPTMTHKKFTIRRCNRIVNIKYKGDVYNIPLSVLNLTLYSKGIHDYKYISTGDAKRNIFVGSNIVTNSMQVGYRIMASKGNAFKITHVNDFEYTRRSDDGTGLIKWLVLQTTLLPEDDKDESIAYNPISEGKVNNNSIDGNNSICIGQSNAYSIEYDGEIEFELDGRYSYASIKDNGNNTCELYQDVEFDEIGNMIGIIAKDKTTGETVDIKNVIIRGI